MLLRTRNCGDSRVEGDSSIVWVTQKVLEAGFRRTIDNLNKDNNVFTWMGLALAATLAYRSRCFCCISNTDEQLRTVAFRLRVSPNDERNVAKASLLIIQK